MAFRIEIGLKKNIRDACGAGVAAGARQALGLHLRHVLTRTVYKIDAELSADEVESVRRHFRDDLAHPLAKDGLQGLLHVSEYLLLPDTADVEGVIGEKR